MCVKYKYNLALTLHLDSDANFDRRSVRKRARNTSASNLVKKNSEVISLTQPDFYCSSTSGHREICLVPAGSSLQGNCAGTDQRLKCLYWRDNLVLDLRCFGKLRRVDLVVGYRRFGTNYRLIGP
jgi:hypothetical protein